MTVLVIDAGTSGVRAVLIGDDGAVLDEEHTEVLPASPASGLVEIDAVTTASAALDLARGLIERHRGVGAVGIANQRATTVAWDARTGEPLGPGIGWQDLRTVGRCLELRAEGWRVAPNSTATKAEWLLQQTDLAPEHVRIGTVDTWLAWHLTDGRHHVTDASNALVTGLFHAAAGTWDTALLERLGIPETTLPRVVDSAGVVAEASALPEAPPLAALIGDQQASMVGQGCIEPGDTKITFGTGGMLDVCLGDRPGPSPTEGTFPMIAWRIGGADTWAREAVMLAAGSSIEWLRDGLGLIESAAESETVAASVEDTGDVYFVPSLSGTGTPEWDHGARGLLVGITRGTTRAHVVRAVLEGIAHRGADLVDSAEEDTGQSITSLRVDGGMSVNEIFVQALADATGRTVEVAGVREATALGAGFLAGVATGVWPDLGTATAGRPPGSIVEPQRRLDRERFRAARDRAAGWIPELSSLDL